ncbi:MAG: response regulator [Coriobacteriales bacterium]|nr:response regulator [Coriobacteriales bacterium]
MTDSIKDLTGTRDDNQRELIMIVDDSISNLKIAKNALSDAFDVLTVLSAAKMFELLKRTIPDIILLDIEMPDMDGYEAIGILKASARTRDIPVIFLTGRGDAESELKGLNLGAADYVAKPFMPALMRKRVQVHLTAESQKHMLEEQANILTAQERMLLDFNDNLMKMVDEKTAKVVELQDTMLYTVANLVESRDDVTGKHIERTERWLSLLIDAACDAGVYTDQITSWDIPLLLRSSQLHDVGKISVSDRILKKPGPLTAEEFSEIKKHATFGVRIIERMESKTTESDFLRYAKILAGTHHEKWDGSGYPDGRGGRDIPLPGRFMALADVYDALTSERPYKRPYPHEKAVGIIMSEKETHFDPALVDIFMRVESRIKEENEFNRAMYGKEPIPGEESIPSEEASFGDDPSKDDGPPRAGAGFDSTPSTMNAAF